jgi:predicted PurR-regulated permease PerM
MAAPSAIPTRTLAMFGLGVLALVVLWALRSIVMMVAFALLLAYILDPLVSALDRLRFGARSVPRPAATAIVILALVALLIWVAVFGVPRLAAELAGFLQRMPANLETLELQIRSWAVTNRMTYVEAAIDSLRANANAFMPQLGSFLLGWLGRMFGGLIQVLGLAVLPILTFYLLAEREGVRASLFRFVPRDLHDRLLHVGDAIDRAMRSYVRGQAFVCVISGIATGLLLLALGIPHALLLGVLVGIVEVIPYLGFAVAAAAIALSGISVSPLTAALGVVAYTVVNNLVGIFVTPRVMGRYLKMHPFVIIVSVLAGAELLGPAGVILALPGAAVIQALIEEFARPAPSRRSAA